MTAAIVLPVKQKYLIGIGASIAAGCQPCTLSFSDAARKAGACERGVRFAIESGLAARENGKLAMAAFASERLPHPEIDAAFRAERITIDALIAVAAAIASNTACLVKAAVGHARELGATDDQIKLAVEVARTARSHAEHEAESALAAALGDGTSSARNAACSTPSSSACGCNEQPQPKSCGGGDTKAPSSCGCAPQVEPPFETVRIEKTAAGCSLCEDYAEQQADKPVVVMSCEGACLRGEISRQAANHLCHVLAPEKTVRLCLGGAFTKDGGQRALVRNAGRVLALEGCPIRCASRMMRGQVPDLQAEVVITEELCDFDRSLFGIDALPAERTQELGRTVATKLAAKL